jgi:hypothetical protein
MLLHEHPTSALWKCAVEPKLVFQFIQSSGLDCVWGGDNTWLACLVTCTKRSSINAAAMRDPRTLMCNGVGSVLVLAGGTTGMWCDWCDIFQLMSALV